MHHRRPAAKAPREGSATHKGTSLPQFWGGTRGIRLGATAPGRSPPTGHGRCMDTNAHQHPRPHVHPTGSERQPGTSTKCDGVTGHCWVRDGREGTTKDEPHGHGPTPACPAPGPGPTARAPMGDHGTRFPPEHGTVQGWRQQRPLQKGAEHRPAPSSGETPQGLFSFEKLGGEMWFWSFLSFTQVPRARPGQTLH